MDNRRLSRPINLHFHQQHSPPFNHHLGQALDRLINLVHSLVDSHLVSHQRSHPINRRHGHLDSQQRNLLRNQLIQPPSPHHSRVFNLVRVLLRDRHLGRSQVLRRRDRHHIRLLNHQVSRIVHLLVNHHISLRINLQVNPLLNRLCNLPHNLLRSLAVVPRVSLHCILPVSHQFNRHPDLVINRAASLQESHLHNQPFNLVNTLRLNRRRTRLPSPPASLQADLQRSPHLFPRQLRRLNLRRYLLLNRRQRQQQRLLVYPRRHRRKLPLQYLQRSRVLHQVLSLL